MIYLFCKYGTLAFLYDKLCGIAEKGELEILEDMNVRFWMCTAGMFGMVRNILGGNNCERNHIVEIGKAAFAL